MRKTIRKLATELHITKQAIYQSMDAIEGFRDNHTTMIGNRIMVDDSGAKLIKNFENINKYDQEQHQENQQGQQDGEFEVLKQQLAVKDEQISKLLDELTQQQDLYKDTLNEIKVLRGLWLINRVVSRNDIGTGDCGGKHIQ